MRCGSSPFHVCNVYGVNGNFISTRISCACFVSIYMDMADLLSVYPVGYNFQCDIKQLAHSYGELECFKHYEMLLDIQNVFKEPRGGLSGLAKVN